MDAITQAQTFATTGASEAWTLILSFLALIIITGVLFAFSLRAGKSSLVSLILSFYIGYAIYQVFPYADAILAIGKGSAVTLVVAKLVIYAIATYIPFYVINRHASNDYFVPNKLIALFACFLAAAFLMAIGYHTFGAKSAYAFTPALDMLFAPASYFFWWFIAPLAGVYLLVR